MSRYSDQIHDEYGRTVPGVSVYVYKWDAVAQVAGDLEILTDDLSAPLANPLTSDIDGLWYFNSVDGQKLLEYHYGGKVQERQLILVGALPVPQAVFGGLLANATALTIPTGMDAIGTTGADVLDHGSANYVAGTAPTARSGFTSANGRNFVLSKEQIITPQMFYQATDPDFQAAMEGARDYLATFQLNPDVSGTYTGAPKLVCPAAPTYLMHDRVDFNHTQAIEGEGHGWLGPGGGGCTHFKWIGTSSGFGFQAFTTHGQTDVDLVAHRASGGCTVRDMCLEGGYVATEGDYHALVLRNAIKATDLYLKNWPGEGVKGWTGNVTGFGAVAGNTSTARMVGVKSENCRMAFDNRGTDSSLWRYDNCEGYQCRQAGFVNENAAGGDKYDSCHATYNGLVGGAPYSRTTYGGNRYTPIPTQELWCKTNAPSGTTETNTGWAYVSAGGADSAHLPWVGGVDWRFGGDYVMLPNCWNATLDACYSEGGGYSHLSDRTVLVGGTNVALSCRGGWSLIPEFDGLALKRNNSSSMLHLDSLAGSLSGVDVRDTGATNTVGGSLWNNQIAFHRASSANGHFFQTLAAGVATTRAMVTTNGVEVPVSHNYYVDAIKVLGARQTGWTADTGTAKRTANATYGAGSTLTFSGTYVQAELTAMATRLAAVETALQNTSQTQKALKDDFITHGAIGA